MVEGYLVSNGPEHACFRTEGTKSDTGKTLQDPQEFKLWMNLTVHSSEGDELADEHEDEQHPAASPEKQPVVPHRVIEARRSHLDTPAPVGREEARVT